MPTKTVSSYKQVISKKQAEQDSMIFGIIMAGAKNSKKPLVRSLPGMETPKGMCAVGSGLRGVKSTRLIDVVTKAYEKKNGKGEANYILHQVGPLIRFATAVGVSENYACGINDGFEGTVGTAKQFYPNVKIDSLDYERGVARWAGDCF